MSLEFLGFSVYFFLIFWSSHAGRFPFPPFSLPVAMPHQDCVRFWPVPPHRSVPQFPILQGSYCNLAYIFQHLLHFLPCWAPNHIHRIVSIHSLSLISHSPPILQHLVVSLQWVGLSVEVLCCFRSRLKLFDSLYFPGKISRSFSHVTTLMTSPIVS